MIKKSDLVVLLDHVGKDDEIEVGKEAARFGEIANLGIPIPKGFIITANAYRIFLQENNFETKKGEHLFVSKAKHLLESGEIPKNLVKEIFRAYKNLDASLRDANVVVGSSFSKKKFSNVKGEANLMQKIRNFWSIYFVRKDIDYSNFQPSILVYRMPVLFQSGVIFTIDPTYHDKSIIVIHEERTKNYYEVSKEFLKIVKKVVEGRKQKLTDRQIINLAKFGEKLQEYYYFPQEVYFSIHKSGTYITKTKPLTTVASKYLTEDWFKAVGKTSAVLSDQIPKNPIRFHKVLARGNSVYPGIATGYLRIIRKPQDVHKLRTGDIAVVANTKNLRFGDLAKKARALVIESRDHLSHHSLPRTLGKPIIVTMPNSNRGLKEGLVATVNGVNGQIYIWHA